MLCETAQFEIRHVLYCDLLGFSAYSKSEFFEASRCFRLFRQLDDLINEATKPIDENQVAETTGQKPDYIVRPEIIYCSDSIIVSTPATNTDAMWLFEAAARIQNGICAHGFLVRGGITTGYLYHSGNTIFGPAIVEAVGKDQPGGPPIIEIDNSTLKYFVQAETDEDREIVRIRKYQLVAEDNNAIPYIDPLWMLKLYANQESILPKNRIKIDIWRDLIERGLKSKSCNILGKYVWMANRFNAVLCCKPSNIAPIQLEFH